MRIIILISVISILISCRSFKTVDKKSKLTKNIYFDNVWKAEDSPIIITGNLWIASPATLKIEPGTKVFFHKDSYITVEGSILAEGSKSNPIHFNSTSPDKHKWEHVYFKNGRKNSKLKSVIFKNANAAVFIENDKVEVTDCMFDSNKYGVNINNASPKITNNLFRNNKTALISFGKNNGKIAHNSFEENRSIAIHGLDNFFPEITKNVFINNEFGIVLKYTKESNKKETPEIIFNDFKDNKKYNLYLENFPKGLRLNASSNYWGSPRVIKVKGSVNTMPNLSNPQFIRVH